MTTQGQAVIYKDGAPVAVRDWDADGYPGGMGKAVVDWARHMVETGEIPESLEDYRVDYTYVINLREDGEDTITISRYGKCAQTYPLSTPTDEMWAQYATALDTFFTAQKEENHEQ